MYELIMNEKELKQLRAELIFEKKLGLIEDDTLGGRQTTERESEKRTDAAKK